MIKFVVFDFDGVFTDGKITIDSNFEVIKSYNVKDGTGIKSLYKNNINVIVISGYFYNKSQSNILKHLEIEHYFNVHNKFDFLKSILRKLKISLEEVAYMGDDINDIECLKNVKLSGVPFDANKECLKVSKFVSNKHGGNGCVRDFCDYVLNYNKSYCTNIPANCEITYNKSKIDKSSLPILQQIYEETEYQLEGFKIIENDIKNLAFDIVSKNKTNNIYICGVGKSLNIAQHTCSILNSIGIKCFLINPLNSIHGDVGYLKKNDMVLFYSKSGNTKEIVNLYFSIKDFNLDFVGICNSNNSKFCEIFKKVLVLPFMEEINFKKNINCIPSNSYLSFTLFTNILTGNVIEYSNINLHTYKKYHPAGNIGNNLKQIKDCLITEFPKLLFNHQIELKKILLEMTEYKIGCCFFVDKYDKLLGILTDGDIRRLIIKESKLDIITIDEINNNFYYENNKEKYITQCKKYNYIPILEDDGTLLAIIKN